MNVVIVVEIVAYRSMSILDIYFWLLKTYQFSYPQSTYPPQFISQNINKRNKKIIINMMQQAKPCLQNISDIQLTQFISKIIPKYYQIEPIDICIQDGFINIKFMDCHHKQECYIAKIYFDLEEYDVREIQAQNQLLGEIAKKRECSDKKGCEYPKVVKCMNGSEMVSFKVKELREVGVVIETCSLEISLRVLTYIKGPLLVSHNKNTTLDDNLMQEYIEQIVRLTKYLRQYSNKTIQNRKHQYHLQHLSQQILLHNSDPFLNQKLQMFTAPQKDLLFSFLKKYHTTILSLQQKAQQNNAFYQAPRKSIIHNDLNKHNVVISQKQEQVHIKGIFDFSDYAYTYSVTEIAVAAAHLCLDVDLEGYAGIGEIVKMLEKMLEIYVETMDVCFIRVSQLDFVQFAQMADTISDRTQEIFTLETAFKKLQNYYISQISTKQIIPQFPQNTQNDIFQHYNLIAINYQKNYDLDYLAKISKDYHVKFANLFERPSPRLPLHFDKTYLPKNICEKEYLNLFQCAMYLAGDRPSQCSYQIIRFQNCRKDRDIKILDGIKRWETKHITDMQPKNRQFYLQGLTFKLDRLKQQYGKIPSTQAKQYKLQQIQSEIKQLKWRMKYIRNLMKSA